MINGYTTKNGTTYTLDLVPGAVLYKWSGPGAMHKSISGMYLSRVDALADIKFYDEHVLESKKTIDVESTPLIELDKLSKKDHLLEFALEHGIQVPGKCVVPTAIKAFIKEELQKDAKG